MLLQAIWENQFYYLFGFLFLVYVILIISCSQISIVMVYFQLCGEVRIVWDQIPQRLIKRFGCDVSDIFDYIFIISFCRTTTGGGDHSSYQEGQLSMSLRILYSTLLQK